MGKVQSATDLGLPDQLNIMLYGEFGEGKTTFATTFPKPILFFDVDKRHQTYAGMDEVDYIVYEDIGKRASAYKEFEKDLRKYQDGKDYATVVIDSTTTLLDIMKNDILGMRGTGSAATEGLSLPQWGTVTERFRRVFSILKGYNSHSIAISHSQMFQDELTGEIKTVTMMVGKKFPQKAPLFFDEIYRCFTENDRKNDNKNYLIQTRSDRKYPARSSMNLRDDDGHAVPILDPVEPQDFNVIMDKVKSARENPEEYLKRVEKERS